MTWVQDLNAKRDEKDAERLAEAAAAKGAPKDEVQLKKPAGESCCHQHCRPLLHPVSLIGQMQIAPCPCPCCKSEPSAISPVMGSPLCSAQHRQAMSPNALWVNCRVVGHHPCCEPVQAGQS